MTLIEAKNTEQLRRWLEQAKAEQARTSDPEYAAAWRRAGRGDLSGRIQRFWAKRVADLRVRLADAERGTK